MRKKSVYTKRELYRLQPGTFIALEWDDASDEIVLLLEKIDIKEKGDISLFYFSFNAKEVSRHAVHRQIVAIYGVLEPTMENICGSN